MRLKQHPAARGSGDRAAARDDPATPGRRLSPGLSRTSWEATTRETYVGYASKHIYPVLGLEPGLDHLHALEQFYAELRRCASRAALAGLPRAQSRRAHECLEIWHKRPPQAGPGRWLSAV
ncbi:hypothetical protein HBB16_07760 [Pseudonocardia sp. MCCB 268]|nr:hypothetical protein [Pseudonocardia cytotoxica]